MSILQFIRLIIRNSKLLFIVPVCIGICIFFFTRDDEEKYASQTSVYTGLASGYSVENGENAKVDFNAISIAFDNIINIIKSRETKEQVALRLLAKHIQLDGKNDKSINKVHLQKLKEKLPAQTIEQVKSKSEEECYQKLCALKNANESNPVYKLINNEKEPYYSIYAINEVKVTRIQASDIIQLSFETDDPGICQDVLQLTTSVFIRNYKKIKSGETSNVADFFEKQTQIAYQKLCEAEERLKQFRTENKIINYDEQTKFISEKHENIIDERNKEKMQLVAAEASVENINQKLGSSQKALKANNDLLTLRNELSTINAKLLDENLNNEQKNSDKISSLAKKSAQLKNQIDDKVDELFQTTTSKEGVSHKDLAKMWIENMLKTDESRAKLSIYGQRLAEIESNYDVFAPLGSNISKMEREIAICEKEYLSHLASLNASKLREQNLQLNSNLQVIDPAFYPVDALPNKKKLVLIAGTMAAFFALLIGLVTTELLDQTIKSVSRAKQFLSYPIISGYPLMGKKERYLTENGTSDKLIKNACSKIYHYLREKPKQEKPFIISVLSSKKGEGKSYISNELAAYFIQLGKKVLIVSPEPSTFSFTVEVHLYSANLHFLELEHFSDLIENERLSSYDLVFVEYPAFCEQRSPIGLLNESDLSLIVVHAGRIWDEADQSALESVKEIQQKQCFGFLNGMNVYQLESLIGEIPVKRSFIRRLLKKWIRFDFNHKN